MERYRANALELKVINVTYDETCDIVYINLAEGEARDSKEFSGYLTLDLSADNRFMGFEIINASAKLPLSLIQYLQNINKIRKAPRDFLAPGC
jgi:uncharacterized protein YuzE